MNWVAFFYFYNCLLLIYIQRCIHPAQQQGRRIPLLSFESVFFIRILLVSDFLADSIQHIHSLRASGVISSHMALANGIDVSAIRKSSGTLCIVPVAISFLVIRLFYQTLCIIAIRTTAFKTI